MKNLHLSKMRIATIVLAILLVSSTYTILSAAAQVDTSTINISTNANSEKLDPETGQPYGDLSQYEFVSAGGDGANTRHTDGPLPDHPQVLWQISRSSSSLPSAFNGMVFVRYSSTVYAFNATTGAVADGWTSTGATGSGRAPGFGSNGAVVKINDQIGSWLASNGPNFFNISNGYVFPKPTIQGQGWTSVGTAGVAMYWGMMYSPEEQCYISVATSSITGKTLGICIDCTDPLGKGAFVRWQVEFDTGLEAMGFGGGNAYFGGYGEGLLWAVDMPTGQIVWRAYKPGNVGYSTTYYDGSVYHSASSTQITRFDAKTGAVLATFDVKGGRAFYVYGMCAQYGRIFAHSIEVPQGWLGGFNCKTLEQQWKYPAYYTIAYLTGIVGDRKFIISASDLSAGSAIPGYPAFTSPGYDLTAVDAFTGQQVWKMLTTASVQQPTPAYGNLYVQIGSTLYCYSDLANPQGISASGGWPFYHGPIDSTGSAPGTSSGNYPSNIVNDAWRFDTKYGISGSPIVANGKVYFGNWAGNLYCLDAYTGTQIWMNSYDCRILSTPAFYNGTIYTGADDGYVYALDADTGATIWKTDAGLLNSEAVQQTAWQPRNSPIVWNNTYMVVGGNNGELYCINPLTGSIIWGNQITNSSIGIGGTVAIHQDLRGRTCIYLMCNAALWQIDITNGRVLSATRLGTSKASCSTPVIVGDLLFVTYGSGAGTLDVRNATDPSIQICSGILSFGTGAMTPMTQTVTYVASQSCTFAVGLNIGWLTSTNAASQYGRYVVNGTARTLTFPCLYVAEATDASCWAIVANGTNLGTGTSNALKWTVNSTTSYYLTRVWNNWAGHQVMSSASVGILSSNPKCPIDYIGNAAYGFTAYNGTTGAVLSTFSADAQVFSTAALANDWVYMTSNDGHCYGFTSGVKSTTTIFADSDKGTTMLVNEPTYIEGALHTSAFFISAYDSNNNATFDHVEVPYANVTLVWVNQDGTSDQINAATDFQGNFNFTYTPTVAGTAQWLVSFNGYTASTGVVLQQAYTPYNTMNVLGGTPSETGTPTPTPSGGTEDNTMTYIYAIIGVIVALIIIIAIVMLLRNRKK